MFPFSTLTELKLISNPTLYNNNANIVLKGLEGQIRIVKTRPQKERESSCLSHTGSA